MKKFNKLSRNTRPQEQPEETYPFGKNGVQNHVQGAIINEPGFLPSSAVIPYTPIGIIETDKFPVIFSSNNTNSAMGYFDVDNDVYIPCLDDATLPFSLPWDTSYYITGQAQRNYKAEMIVAFTDKYNVPYYVNVDVPNANTLNDIKLFPNAQQMGIDVVVETGGILLPGAYYVAVKYTKTDGTETGFVSVSAPATVNGTSSVATDKALQITLTDVDPDYDNVQIAIIVKTNGVLSAVQFISPIKAQNGAMIVYSGTEITEAITLEEILTPRKVYTKVGTMGQLNDSLYIADLESAPQIKMQPWANLVRLSWHSKLITVEPVYEPMTTGKEKSHMHGEVYAFYIRYKKSDGTNTASFPLIGEDLTSGDRLTSTPGTAEGITAPKFAVEDTIPSFSTTTNSGYFGKWENETEFYPNTADFNSLAVGGTDLRGQKVRHHRFPSINWCKQNLYAGNPNYGRNALDMLGVRVENVIIPAQYASEIIGWEIFYAKRNVANSTVIGQSLMLFGGRNKWDVPLAPTNYYSSGGNWNSFVNTKTTEHLYIYLDQSVFHFYSFDMLLGKPSVSPDYMALQLRHRRLNFPYTGGVIEDQAVTPGENNGPIVFNLDYLQKGDSPILPSKIIKAVKETQHVPNNIDLGKWHNPGIEGFFGGRITNPELLIANPDVYVLEVQPASRRSYTPNEKMPLSETCFLANMMSIKQQLFVPFTAQPLVREGSSNTISNATIFYGGDTYINDYTFHTYGNWVSDQSPADGKFGNLFMGTKVARRFVCESAANLYARFEDPVNMYSRYYPKSSMIGGDVNNYLTNFIRSNDPNQFGYRKDSNALDDLFSASIYDTNGEDLYIHPYRIHRLGKLGRQTKMRNWRTCLPLDYYEAQKNMGRIIHLEGMDDRLIIHHENAMFLTQDKAKLESDIIAVTLGSGDIFQFAPQEGASAKLGYAGTQHDLACIRTVFGYIFIDSLEGNIFIYKGQLELLNKELDTFFQQWLRIKEKNPFIGNGYTLGYDSEYKRLLLTVRNRQLASALPVPAYDSENIGSYTAGDLLLKDGRIVEFLGVNATIYNCEAVLVPTANNLTLTIAENTAAGTAIGTLTGTNVVNYYITGSSSPFALNASTGVITVSGPLNYYTAASYVFNGLGYGESGNSDAFVLTINLTMVNRPPVVPNKEVTISDTATNGTAVATIAATDREGGTLTYSITAGNTDSVFAINSSTGAVTVADATQLDGIGIPLYSLTISVTDGTLAATGTLRVNVTHVNRAPVVADTAYTILDTTPDDTVIAILDLAVDLEADPLTYTLIAESIPGIFSFDPATLELTLLLNSSLNPLTVPVYTFNFTVTDGFVGHSVPFTVTVNVTYDRSSIQFSPDVPSCTSGTPSCAIGYTLSVDETVCVKTTTTAPTVTGSGCLAASPNAAYGSYFTRIYNSGFHAATIAEYTASIPADVFAEVNTAYWLSVPNAIAVWVDSDCNGTPNSLAAGVQTTVSYNYNNTGAARTVYVGVFGDNEFELKVNGASIVATTDVSSVQNFKIFHIFPVSIINGTNIFNIVGTGDGSVGDAIGMNVYDNTAADIQAAAADLDLTILFSTFDMIGDANDVSTCPVDYVLDTSGAPICKKIETAIPTGGANVRHWDKVRIADLRHGSAVITTVDNQLTPVLTFQDINVPYYADIVNHIDCGSTVVHYLSVAKSGSAQKNNCTTGIGTVIEYTVPAGSYLSTVSQAAADALAQADVDTNKQSYANTNGLCL